MSVLNKIGGLVLFGALGTAGYFCYPTAPDPGPDPPVTVEDPAVIALGIGAATWLVVAPRRTGRED